MIQRASRPRILEPSPRLIFLGAGFSRPAGLPLAKDLLALALDEIHRHFADTTKVESSLERYRRYLRETTGTSSDPIEIDIEQFIAFLDYEHVLGLRGSDTWSDDGNEDQLMLRWGIGAALHHATPSVDDLPDQYLEFAATLRPRDCVVTFNYDRVLEDTLASVGIPYRRFPMRYAACHDMHAEVDSDRDGLEVLILKVHGSVDWVDRSAFERSLQTLALSGADESFRRRHRVFGEASITTSRPLVEGPRPDDDPLRSVIVLDDLNAYYCDLNVWHHAAPLILAPSAAKLLYGAAMREFWRGMPLDAWAWSGLVIIGYSLPPADPYARQVLWSIGTSYETTYDDPDWSFSPKQRVKVVDYRTSADDACALQDSYRFLDPDITDCLLDGFNSRAVAELFSD